MFLWMWLDLIYPGLCAYTTLELINTGINNHNSIQIIIAHDTCRLGDQNIRTKKTGVKGLRCNAVEASNFLGSVHVGP